MTAPASPPLTLEEIAATERNAPGSSMPAVWKETILALVAEVRSSRLAAERAEGLARAAEEVLGAPLGPSPIVIDVAREHLRAAVAAYRAPAGGGGDGDR